MHARVDNTELRAELSGLSAHAAAMITHMHEQLGELLAMQAAAVARGGHSPGMMQRQQVRLGWFSGGAQDRTGQHYSPGMTQHKQQMFEDGTLACLLKGCCVAG